MPASLGLATGDGDDGSDRGLDGLDVAQTLAAAEESALAVHRAEVWALEVDLHYARLHSSDPQAGRGPRPPLEEAGRSGMTLGQWEAAGNKLVQLAGDGAPLVQDLPLAELAIARGATETSTRHRVADVLDLAHRLPGYWTGLRHDKGTVWVGRKVARMSRHLDRDQVRIVDAAVTAAIHQSPGRVLAIAEAAVLRADPDHAREQAHERARRRYVALGRSLGGDEAGLRKVFGLIDDGDAAWLDAMLERIADTLQSRPDLLTSPDSSRDELRAEALGWLAHPDDVIALLAGTYGLDETDPEAEPTVASTPSPSRQSAVLYIHLSEAAVQGHDSVGRVEALGPRLLDEVRDLLGHANVVVKPVIDLNQGRSVNGYEHPVDVRERGFLRTTGDVFPHAQTQSRRVDNEHPKPYDVNGPPGQTGDHNHAPLGRRHHRAKTHLGYQVHQVRPGTYLWRTPHGLWRLVDGSGTHRVQHADDR